ncbi:GIY-YIG nuclease family protein [uncultured Photobacterium sp.]|uniref:GIY-YIG nuclease family protein n=1 Tax=uncultured Photobacterium sp. TaxID=173973 RepID=UPI00261E52D5|nr:GIY-YIG nuclease family protein [uncultured Photobacterium sp.]
MPALFEVVEKKDKAQLKAAEWWVYLIRTASDHLYCGVTTDVERRFREHQNSKKGAKFLKGKGPLVLAWSELVGDKKKAMQLEYRIKRLSKAKKESIVDKNLQVNALME